MTMKDFLKREERLGHKDKVKEYKKLSEAEQTLLMIYFIDRTPEYSYGTGKKAQTAEGKIARCSRRWKTPREVIRDYFYAKGFWGLYETYCKFKETEL